MEVCSSKRNVKKAPHGHALSRKTALHLIWELYYLLEFSLVSLSRQHCRGHDFLLLWQFGTCQIETSCEQVWLPEEGADKYSSNIGQQICPSEITGRCWLSVCMSRSTKGMSKTGSLYGAFSPDEVCLAYKSVDRMRKLQLWWNKVSKVEIVSSLGRGIVSACRHMDLQTPSRLKTHHKAWNHVLFVVDLKMSVIGHILIRSSELSTPNGGL